MWKKHQHKLIKDEKDILDNISENWNISEGNHGCFLTANNTDNEENKESFWSLKLGNIDFKRAIGLERVSPWWVKPFFITDINKIPVDSCWIVFETNQNEYILIAPLPDYTKGSVASLFSDKNFLHVRIDTNDPAVGVDSTQALYIAQGCKLYQLCSDSMQEIRNKLNTFRLRNEKKDPEFIDSFGWCTWDAFYQTVSEEKVFEGLEKWKESDIALKMIILDDGWLSTKPYMGGIQLTNFAPNEKFPNGLKDITEKCKKKYGIDYFFVWHALNGYWGGVDPDSFPEYNITLQKRSYNEDICGKDPKFNEYCWGKTAGVVSEKDIYLFMNDFHRFLKQHGVDGVKVDSQSSLQGVCKGLGGRAKAMLHYRDALEGSVSVNFNGNLINCMSNSPEMYYSASCSSVMRTSQDFFPKDDDSHGDHLICNAYTGIWFGEIGIPDWDMFHSQHMANSFHAAARAISGSPIYVSDTPDNINSDLLKQLVLPNGKILRCLDRAIPFPSSVFDSPREGENALILFNKNKYNFIAGVFNCTNNHNIDIKFAFAIKEILPEKEDVPLAVLDYKTKKINIINSSEIICGELKHLDWNLFTVKHIINGWASLGSEHYMNSGGIIKHEKIHKNYIELTLFQGNEFIAYSQHNPSQCIINGEKSEYSYENSIFKVKLPEDELIKLEVTF